MMDSDVKTANAIKPQDRSSMVDRGPCGSVSVEEVSVFQDSGQSYHIAQQSHFGVFTSRKHVIVENHTWVVFFFLQLFVLLANAHLGIQKLLCIQKLERKRLEE